MKFKSILNLAVVLLLAAFHAQAEELFPTAEGTTWHYESTDQSGGKPVESVVSVRIEKSFWDEKDALKFETRSGDSLTKTELMRLDNQALVCLARSDRRGKITAVKPPQVIIPAALKVATAWELDGQTRES